MIDLLKLLKAGDSVYSLIHGKMMKVKSIESAQELCLNIGNVYFNKRGSILANGADCLVFPNQNEKSWDNYSPFKPGETVLAFPVGDNPNFIGVFSHIKESQIFVYKNRVDGEYSLQCVERCEYIDIKL